MSLESLGARFHRHTHIAPKVLFLNAVSGSGKALFGPIVSSLDRVEKHRLEHIFEYLGIQGAFGKVSQDVVVSMMKLYADFTLYNNLISREVNLRPFDDTGIIPSPFRFRYLARLFTKDGDAVMERIKGENPILCVCTLHLHVGLHFAFEAIGERLRIFEIVRHPLFLIKHWASYIDRIGTDPREFSLWISDEAGGSVPWFAAPWKREFRRWSAMDKAIRSLDWITAQRELAYKRLNSAQMRQVLFLPFEHFVVDPWPLIRQMEILLETKATPATCSMLKYHKCPRKAFTDGRGHRGYGWKKPKNDSNNKTEAESMMEMVQSRASDESKQLFIRLCEDYEARFGVNVICDNRSGPGGAAPAQVSV